MMKALKELCQIPLYKDAKSLILKINTLVDLTNECQNHGLLKINLKMIMIPKV
jgi:hypothetical protein